MKPVRGPMTTIQKTKEFVVTLENKPGKLAEFTRAVATVNVNILGIDVAPNGGQGSIRLLVNDPAKFEQTLQAKGLRFQAFDVLSVRLPNRPGSLAEISERLAKGGVDIESLYGYVGHDGSAGDTDFVVKVHDVASAEKLLGAL